MRKLKIYIGNLLNTLVNKTFFQLPFSIWIYTEYSEDYVFSFLNPYLGTAYKILLLKWGKKIYLYQFFGYNQHRMDLLEYLNLINSNRFEKFSIVEIKFSTIEMN